MSPYAFYSPFLALQLSGNIQRIIYHVGALASPLPSNTQRRLGHLSSNSLSPSLSRHVVNMFSRRSSLAIGKRRAPSPPLLLKVCSVFLSRASAPPPCYRGCLEPSTIAKGPSLVQECTRRSLEIILTGQPFSRSPFSPTLCG